MIGQFLRRQFDSGGAGFYLFVSTPVALLLAFGLPSSFAPFLTAAAFFPVYFYFARREDHLKAILFFCAWAMMEFSALSSVVSLNPDVVGPALGLAAPNPLAAPFGWRMADLLYSALLSVASGGAFFLVKAAVKINDAAFYFGTFLGAGNLTGAFSALAPWKLVTGFGHVLIAHGAAGVFYAKLEGAVAKWRTAAILTLAGVSVGVAGWGLETLLYQM